MGVQQDTEKLNNDLMGLVKELETTTDPEIIRELCIKANNVLMRYNLDTWNKMYRETLPKQPEKQAEAPLEREIEFDMPPV